MVIFIDCFVGFFCVSGSIFSIFCVLGIYSNFINLRRSIDCIFCLGGYYCDGIGRIVLIDVCDLGFYCREKVYFSVFLDGFTGGLCFVGGYCFVGFVIFIVCFVGEYSKSVGVKIKFDCIFCDFGFYCVGFSSIVVSFKCVVGFYCIGGLGVFI